MTRTPDVDSLRLLVLAGRLGSVTRAAAVAGVSQPMASKRLDALERGLGLRLLERTRRGSSLTAAGTVVSGWAERVLAELDVLVEGVEAMRRRANAQLSVAASLTVAENLLPGWVGELRRRAPDVHVGLDVMNSERVLEVVRAGGVDVGFVESPERAPDLRSRVVARDRLVLVVAPDHPWARRRRPVDVTTLAATPLVSREAGSGTRATVDRALRQAGGVVVPPALELGSSTAVRSAVAAGAGAAVLSELVVAADLASGALVEVPTDGLALERAMRAVWRPDTPPAGAVATLLACAAQARVRG